MTSSSKPAPTFASVGDVTLVNVLESKKASHVAVEMESPDLRSEEELELDVVDADKNYHAL